MENEDSEIELLGILYFCQRQIALRGDCINLHSHEPYLIVGLGLGHGHSGLEFMHVIIRPADEMVLPCPTHHNLSGFVVDVWLPNFPFSAVLGKGLI